MTELKNNAVMQLYRNFKKDCDHAYVHQFEDSEEMIAFAHGVLAAIYLLNTTPEELIDPDNGRSLSQDLDEILVSKSNLQ
jgi:hypothetical protein